MGGPGAPKNWKIGRNLNFSYLKNSSEEGILGILLQTVIKRVLLLFYGITFNLDKIKSQIEFHSKA